MPPLNSKERVAAVKSIAVSSVIAAIVTALIVTLALFVSPLLSAVFSSLPSSLVFFAASASIFDDKQQEASFDNFLFLVAAVFYVLLLITTLTWYACNMHAFKNDSWRSRVWKSFGCCMAVWLTFSVAIIVLYYTNSSAHAFLSPAAVPIEQLAKDE